MSMHPELQRCYDIAIRGAWTHPFFLIPLGHCEWHEGNPETVKTMTVSTGVKEGKPEINLYVNTEWVKGLPDDEVFGVLAHEMLHPMLRHGERSGGKNLETWAKATDMAINASLVQSGIKIPSVGLLPPREHYEDAAEELYTLLDKGEIPQPKNYDPDKATAGCQEQSGNPNQNGDQQVQGDGDGQGGSQPGNQPGDQPGDGSGGGEDQNEERAWGEMIAQSQAHSRGTGAAKALAKLFTPKPTKTKWDRLLKHAANQSAAKAGRDVQSWQRVNRRVEDIILPGWKAQRPAISVIIDTSGSVSDEMLRASLSNVIQVAKISGVRFFLALHDGEVYFKDWIKPETTVQNLSKLCGQRGGTYADPAFEAVGEVKAKFDALIYLTDGEVGTYPAKPMNCKRVVVGIVGDRKHSYRAKIPDGWQEIFVDVEV